MAANAKLIAYLPAKLFACILVFVFLVLGTVGLILPIIPGVLFLVVAAVIVARHFPAMDVWLRQFGTIGKYLDWTDRFLALTLRGKLQFSGLVCVKIVLEGIVLIRSSVAKLLKFAEGVYRRPR